MSFLDSVFRAVGLMRIGKRSFRKVSPSTFSWEVGKKLEGVFSDSEISFMYQRVKLPKRATAQSAAYDVFSPVDATLCPGEEILIPTGWKVKMTPGQGLFFIPRSGQGFKYYIRLANTVGLVDSDYYNNVNNEGHCWVKLRNEGNKTLSIMAGEAIAQCYFSPVFLADGDDYSSGDVRKGGFGSTG